jgi:phage terminase small subunit
MASKKKNYELAEQDYMAGMKYKDIAEKYGVSINTVKSWKRRYKWNRDSVHTKNQKGVHTKEGATKEVKELIKNESLTDKQKLFCVYYIKYFNATKAYQKAYGCNYMAANANGPALLVKDSIKEEIERLKEGRLNRAMLSEDDIVQKYIDIAFGDITDYVEFGKTEKIIGISKDGDLIKTEDNFIDLKNDYKVDGTLIKEIKSSRQGISVKLEDRMKALEWLSNFFEMNPEHKLRKEFNEKKIQLERERLKHQKDMDERRLW